MASALPEEVMKPTEDNIVEKRAGLTEIIQNMANAEDRAALEK